MEVTQDGPGREDFLLTFGKRVRALRHQAGLSQIALAEASGMHRVTIGLVERGKREIGVSQVPPLAAGFGIEAGDLFAGLEA